MITEGRIAGIDFWEIYNWTVSEINDFIDVYRERMKREGQRRAMDYYEHAMLIARLFGGKDSGPIMVADVFPQYFTEKEREDALKEYWTSKFTESVRKQNGR